MSVTEVIFSFLGGLGIFLYGLKIMGDGLQASAGDRLRNILNKYTSNPVLGVLAGMIVTILIQSSTGTTVITIGLVTAGFMTLKQAIGVIMGANIGTTVTAFIIGIDLGEYAMPILALGAFLIFFFKRSKINNIGRVLFGFGSLFFGLEFMGGAVKPLAELEGFRQLMLEMSSHTIYGILVGIGLTALVQSSSATIGILQEFYSQDLITLQGAIPVLLGDNIGTTITAILASLAGSLAAKRAAFVHVIFNVIGVIIFTLLLPIVIPLIATIQDAWHLKPVMTIAFAHGAFNVTNTLIQLPFVGVLAWIVTKIVPGKDVTEDYKPQHLNKDLVYHAPGVALQETQKELQNVGNIVRSMLDDVHHPSQMDKKMIKNVQQKHQAVVTISDSIRNYLVRISTKNITRKDVERLAVMFDVNRSILKVSELIEAYIEQVNRKKAKEITLTEDAERGIDKLYRFVDESFTKAIETLDVYDTTKKDEVVERSREAFNIEHQLRKGHIKRLNRGECSTDGGLLYVDIIAVLERIGYNSRNISEAMVGLNEDVSTEEEVVNV
ncbi:TPA: Na/Pi cotransporter family protein [Staphylococcus pseudintermedius]|uniref:Na/Pi cotransporter family protein n=1 Tax=Staphylococcus pseudintermedius TaxID=283734 RepID=UPI0018E1644B|nr:Na/Pi cotransporter family protein [Staphylococcus pseudintermedius]EGQ1617833.1 Na/Pi cotransporter family protein [Staphylococcus pseudintermedius]EGQ1649166.1 Na/Pi cotransporter family protein [Staphylococcus pseudintermedius]EGQ2712003.1 Na/Pi cotransporter family protein [Staphylococcus pseudintermedius]EGQ3297038.1 Na/Pi cotransporter family protein [Staphylococcus pseudintermedius]EGQ4039060.1 Na/Pi cotransporter family protein [Staphylococcus pseudintermedius]